MTVFAVVYLMYWSWVFTHADESSDAPINDLPGGVL